MGVREKVCPVWPRCAFPAGVRGGHRWVPCSEVAGPDPAARPWHARPRPTGRRVPQLAHKCVFVHKHAFAPPLLAASLAGQVGDWWEEEKGHLIYLVDLNPSLPPICACPLPRTQERYYWKLTTLTKGDNSSLEAALVAFSKGLAGDAAVPRSKYLFDAVNLPQVGKRGCDGGG